MPGKGLEECVQQLGPIRRSEPQRTIGAKEATARQQAISGAVWIPRPRYEESLREDHVLPFDGGQLVKYRDDLSQRDHKYCRTSSQSFSELFAGLQEPTGPRQKKTTSNPS